MHCLIGHPGAVAVLGNNQVPNDLGAECGVGRFTVLVLMVLVLIASLAAFILWLLGTAAERRRR